MILVTGATGNVGREVVNLLLEGSMKVVAVTRHPATAALRGVEAVLVSPRARGGCHGRGRDR